MAKKPNPAIEKLKRDLARQPRAVVPEGVQPLNEGFFRVQALRVSRQAKLRSAVAPKLRGNR